MLKKGKLTKRIALQAILFAVLINFLVAVVIYAQFSEYANQYAQHHEREALYSVFIKVLIAPFVYLLRGIVAHPEVITAAATVAIGVYTWALVGVTRELKNLAIEQEAATKKRERAYLIAGPFLGVPKKENFNDKLSEWRMNNRAISYLFHGPWRMSVTNFGKTAAYSTKIEWGLCPLSDFPLDIMVSDLLDSTTPKHVEWRSKWIRGHVFPENIFGERNRPYQLRHIQIDERNDYLGWVHFGRVSYQDVFKQPHYACFAYYILEDQSAAIGRSISTDHN